MWPPRKHTFLLASFPARGLLTTSSDGSMSSEASSSGFLSSNKIGSSSRANGFAVTTITRGWSAEADKLLDYLVSSSSKPVVIRDLIEYHRRTESSMLSRSNTFEVSFLRFI